MSVINPQQIVIIVGVRSIGLLCISGIDDHSLFIIDESVGVALKKWLTEGGTSEYSILTNDTEIRLRNTPAHKLYYAISELEPMRETKRLGTSILSPEIRSPYFP